MARKFRKKTLLFKKEVTYGVDPTPTGAANSVLTKNLTINPMQGPTVNRDVDRVALGNDLTYHTGPHTQMTFQVELAGSGTAGTAPAYAPLSECCGWGETINAGVSAQYDPISDAEPSGTAYFYMDGILHKGTGGRGTVRFVLSPGGIPMLEFDFLFLRVAPTDTALPTTDFTAFKVPEAITDANTPTFTLFGVANLNLVELAIDMAVERVYRNVVGQEEVVIVDRAPAGTLTIDEPLLATHDFHADIFNHTTGALSFIHGDTAGNIIEFSASTVQLLNPRVGENNGVATLQVDTRFIPGSAGNDEIQLLVR